MPAQTIDQFLHGAIVLNQPRSGYRFSIDAVILAHLVRPTDDARIVDLGTGCGVIPIILAHRRPTVHITGVEIQPELAALARQNVAANRMDDRIQIIEQDMRILSSDQIGGPVDWVVTNPPYRPLGSGRISVHSQRALARHELSVDLQAVLATAERLLIPSGRLAIIYPSVRLVDLITAMRQIRLEPKALTMIHSSRDTPARLVAIEGVKGGRPGIAVAPPLYLYREDGTYTRDVEIMLSRYYPND